LIYLIARRYFGDITGAVAGLLVAFYGPLLYFEMVLLRETLIVSYGLLLVWLVSRATDRPTWAWWLTAGLAMGVSLTLKSHFALFILGVLVLLAVQFRSNLKQLFRLEAVALLGIAIGVAPMVARNVAVGVQPFTSSRLGRSRRCARLLQPTGNRRRSGPAQENRRILGQTGGRLVPSIFATLQINGNGSFVRGLLDKFSGTWNWWGPPDNTNFYYYRLHSVACVAQPSRSSSCRRWDWSAWCWACDGYGNEGRRNCGRRLAACDASLSVGV